MKKIFTLLFAVGTIGIVSAQSIARHDNKFDSRPGVELSGRGNETFRFPLKEKDAMIRKINAEFDRKVKAVQSDRRLKRQEKSKQIKMLNKQRAGEIRLVQVRFEKANRSNDRHDDGRKGYRS